MKMRSWIHTLGGRSFGVSVLTSLLLGAAGCAGLVEENDKPLPPARSTAPHRPDPMTCEEALSRITAALLSSGDELPPDVLRQLDPFAPNPVCSSAGLYSTVTFTEASGGDSALSAMRAFWANVDATWNARDLDAFIGLFADEATFHVIAREALVAGRDGIRARFAAQFSRQAPDLRHVTRVGRVEHLGPGLAALDAQVRVLRVAPDEHVEPAVLRKFAVFAIMARNPEAWVIRDIRIYTLPEDLYTQPALSNEEAKARR